MMKMVGKILAIFLLGFIFSNNLYSQVKADDIVGEYLTYDKLTKQNCKIGIFKLPDNTYSGKVIWLEKPLDKDGKPYCDVLNPDPSKRHIRCDNMTILYGFTFKKGEWVGGKVYNPTNGKTYTAKMNFETETKLKLRGYVGHPMFGATEYWTKIK
ncbi:MAG TPA: DUF2147 domain-containing protein [Bacteroidales bacterium]|nr:DUF2147 domain-containing protein [Bacteroidales bacterium]HQB21495.1 DUF2147 domain-containing protein [Bacteroidales bacterium]